MKKILTVIIIVVALQLGAVSIVSASGGGGGSYHKVHYGETLYSIARHYGVSAHRIARVNGLYDPNYIYAGQVLYIPAGSGYDGGYGDGYYGGGTRHRVRYGETLFSIGRKYNVNPYRIARTNGLYNPNYIYAGQVLRIPSGSRYPGSGCDGYRQGCDSNYWSDCDGYNRQGCDRNYRSDCGGYGSDCGGQYGYDYTGYYYNYGNRQYSYTCGYYYNCW